MAANTRDDKWLACAEKGMQAITSVDDLRAWRSYYYFAGGHSYREPRYDTSGGPGGSPCIWADDSMWAIDTPEQPHSILFLLQYRIWGDAPPLDLRNAELRLRLCGDNLALHGARCYFWVATQLPTTTRWHCTAQPIAISPGQWQEPVVLRLSTDPAHWHRSFTSNPANAAGIDEALALCVSYGFSFVGFSQKVTGRVGLAEFALLANVDPAWPLFFPSQSASPPWLTRDRVHQGPVPIARPPSEYGETPPGLGREEAGLCLHGESLVTSGDPVRYAYLAFFEAAALGKRDLRNALLIVRHNGTAFDAAGGKICFFVEHTASGTRWVLRVPFETADTDLFYELLVANPAFWARLSGSLGLAEVLAGRESETGYDLLGFVLIEPQGSPRGLWELIRFSLGPTVDGRWTGQQGD